MDKFLNLFIPAIISASAIAAIINFLSSWFVQKVKVNTAATDKVTEGRNTWRIQMRELISDSRTFSKADYNKILSNLNAYTNDENNLEYYMSDCHIKNIIKSPNANFYNNGISKDELVRQLLRLSLKYDWERSKIEMHHYNRHFTKFYYVEQIDKFYKNLKTKYYRGKELPKSFGRYEDNLPDNQIGANTITKNNILFKFEYPQSWIYLLIFQIISSFIILTPSFSKFFNIPTNYDKKIVVSFLILLSIDVLISYIYIKTKTIGITAITLIEIAAIISIFTYSVCHSIIDLNTILSILGIYLTFSFLGFSFLLIRRSL